jgi:hypothetical protein
MTVRRIAGYSNYFRKISGRLNLLWSCANWNYLKICYRISANPILLRIDGSLDYCSNFAEIFEWQNYRKIFVLSVECLNFHWIDGSLNYSLTFGETFEW